MAWLRPPICSKCGGPSTRENPCKPCRNAYQKEWNRKRGVGGREVNDEFTGQPYAAQKRWKARHPEANKAQRAAYKQKPEVKMASRLRANLSRAWNGGGYGAGAPDVTEHDFRRMVERQHGMCAVCARTDRPLTIDHIHPISKGGTNALDNLQALCRPCNTGKMTKTFSGIGYLLVLQGLTVIPHRGIHETRSKRPSRKRHEAETKI
jgi:5-methylcytosine-specific restriction endonuclease McrA